MPREAAQTPAFFFLLSFFVCGVWNENSAGTMWRHAAFSQVGAEPPDDLPGRPSAAPESERPPSSKTAALAFPGPVNRAKASSYRICLTPFYFTRFILKATCVPLFCSASVHYSEKTLQPAASGRDGAVSLVWPLCSHSLWVLAPPPLGLVLPGVHCPESS